MIQKELKYNKDLLSEWRKKSLRELWWEKYGVFDCEDLRIAITQSRHGYHFGEWYVATKFAKQGYKVLVEKYRSHKTHKQKYDKLFDYFTPEEVDFLTKSKNQPPDLFVFNKKERFFVEVKRDTDKMSPSQKKFFEEIEKRLRCEILIYHLRLSEEAL